MRRICLATALTFALLSAGTARATSAEDFKIHQLGNPSEAAADMRFRLFVNQLGVALSGFNFSPAQTLGHSGFGVSLEYGVAKIDSAYWPRYSQSDSNFVFLPSLHVRKGLGFSFELDGRLTYLQNSRMAAGTLALKWALNEGFTYAPDFAVRGHVTKLFGATDFDLTTAGVDVGIGKEFGLGGVMTLTPYIGWNLLFVHATSRLIETEPTRDEATAMSEPLATLNYFSTVDMADNFSHRFYGGLRFIFATAVEIGLEFSYTRISVSHDIEELPSQMDVMTFGGKFGVDF